MVHLTGSYKGVIMSRDPSQFNNTTCYPQKFPPKSFLSCCFVSDSDNHRGGISSALSLLSRLSQREQQEASCRHECLPCQCCHSVPHTPNQLSNSQAGCPPGHLFLIACLCLSADPTVGLFTCLSLVHLPLVSLIAIVHDDRTATTTMSN